MAWSSNKTSCHCVETTIVWVMWAGFEGNDDCSKKRWYVRPLYKVEAKTRAGC